MKRAKGGEEGQVLPLTLICLAAVLASMLFMLNAGRLLIERERSRMRSDVSALSAATAYARALNMDAALRKAADTLDAAAMAVGWFPWGGEFVEIADEVVDEAKNAFEIWARWLVLAEAEFIAAKNGLAAIPLWNVNDLLEPSGLAQGAMPDLKLGENDGSGGGQSGGGSGQKRYSYLRHDSGRKVVVAWDKASKDGAGGAKGRERDSETGRFVHKDEGGGKTEHSITLLSEDWLRQGGDAGAGLKALPHFSSLSRARVAGGNFDYFSTESMQWGVYLAPLTQKDGSLSLDFHELPTTGWQAVDSAVESVNQALRRAKTWAARVPSLQH